MAGNELLMEGRGLTGNDGYYPSTYRDWRYKFCLSHLNKVLCRLRERALADNIGFGIVNCDMHL